MNTPDATARLPVNHSARWLVAHGILVCALFFMNACAAFDHVPEAPQRFEFIAPHMGMQARIVLHANDPDRAKAAADPAFAEIGRLDRMLSDWREDSEVARLNAAAGREPVAVSDEFIDVLQRSMEVSRMSDGAFDVTIGPVMQLWREAIRSQQQPSTDEIERAHELVNWRDVEVDRPARTVRLKRAGMRLDLGGIGKGFAADRALDILRQHDCPSAMIAIAGDIRLGDPPPATAGWTIAIDDGLTPQHTLALALANCGISTSGDREQSLIIDGVHHSHIIHPQHGVGLADRIAVTVIAPDATASDAIGTAVSVMGAERGLAMIENLDGVAARVVEMNDGVPRAQQNSRFPK